MAPMHFCARALHSFVLVVKESKTELLCSLKRSGNSFHPGSNSARVSKHTAKVLPSVTQSIRSIFSTGPERCSARNFSAREKAKEGVFLIYRRTG